MPLPKPQRLTVREVTDLLAQVVDDATSSAGLHEFLAGSFKKKPARGRASNHLFGSALEATDRRLNLLCVGNQF
jgi:hypothetical protein